MAQTWDFGPRDLRPVVAFRDGWVNIGSPHATHFETAGGQEPDHAGWYDKATGEIIGVPERFHEAVRAKYRTARTGDNDVPQTSAHEPGAVASGQAPSVSSGVLRSGGPDAPRAQSAPSSGRVGQEDGQAWTLTAGQREQLRAVQSPAVQPAQPETWALDLSPGVDSPASPPPPVTPSGARAYDTTAADMLRRHLLGDSEPGVPNLGLGVSPDEPGHDTQSIGDTSALASTGTIARTEAWALGAYHLGGSATDVGERGTVASSAVSYEQGAYHKPSELSMRAPLSEHKRAHRNPRWSLEKFRPTRNWVSHEHEAMHSMWGAQVPGGILPESGQVSDVPSGAPSRARAYRRAAGKSSGRDTGPYGEFGSVDELAQESHSLRRVRTDQGAQPYGLGSLTGAREGSGGQHAAMAGAHEGDARRDAEVPIGMPIVSREDQPGSGAEWVWPSPIGTQGTPHVAGPPAVYYHVAPQAAREMIQQHGLDASRGQKMWTDKDYPVATYLHSDWFDAHARATHHHYGRVGQEPIPMDIWKVHPGGLTLEVDPLSAGGTYRMVRHPIPPSNLTLVPDWQRYDMEEPDEHLARDSAEDSPYGGTPHVAGPCRYCAGAGAIGDKPCPMCSGYGTSEVREREQMMQNAVAPDPYLCPHCGSHAFIHHRGYVQCRSCGMALGIPGDENLTAIPKEPEPAMLAHPDPWMDNEPGAMTFPEHWASGSHKWAPRTAGTPEVHTAGMTLPQQQRAWQALNPQSEIIHTFDDGSTIQRHFDPKPVGTFMRNCWQDKEGPSRMGEVDYAALHDQYGLPRVAFYHHKGRNHLMWPLGVRNRIPDPDYAAPIASWATANGMMIAGRNGRGSRPYQPEDWLNNLSEDYEAQQKTAAGIPDADYDPSVNARLPCPLCFPKGAPDSYASIKGHPSCAMCGGSGMVSSPRNTEGYRTPIQDLTLYRQPGWWLPADYRLRRGAIDPLSMAENEWRQEHGLRTSAYQKRDRVELKSQPGKVYEVFSDGPHGDKGYWLLAEDDVHNMLYDVPEDAIAGHTAIDPPHWAHNPFHKLATGYVGPLTLEGYHNSSHEGVAGVRREGFDFSRHQRGTWGTGAYAFLGAHGEGYNPGGPGEASTPIRLKFNNGIHTVLDQVGAIDRHDPGTQLMEGIWRQADAWDPHSRREALLKAGYDGVMVSKYMNNPYCAVAFDHPNYEILNDRVRSGTGLMAVGGEDTPRPGDYRYVAGEKWMAQNPTGTFAKTKLAVPIDPGYWEDEATGPEGVPLSQWNDGEPGKWESLYHGTTAERAGRIMTEGLKPWDHPDVDRHNWNSGWDDDNWLEPRPDHTYLTNDKDFAWRVGSGIRHDGEGGAVLEIDPAYVDPQHINPDEDTAERWRGDYPREPYHTDYPTKGEWAEGIGYGDDPHETTEIAKSRHTHSLAYRGVVPPQGIKALHTFTGISDDGPGGWRTTPNPNYRPMTFAHVTSVNPWKLSGPPPMMYEDSDIPEGWTLQQWRAQNPLAKPPIIHCPNCQAGVRADLGYCPQCRTPLIYTARTGAFYEDQSYLPNGTHRCVNCDQTFVRQGPRYRPIAPQQSIWTTHECPQCQVPLSGRTLPRHLYQQGWQVEPRVAWNLGDVLRHKEQNPRPACLNCGKTTGFYQGKCLNCGYQIAGDGAKMVGDLINQPEGWALDDNPAWLNLTDEQHARLGPPRQGRNASAGCPRCGGPLQMDHAHGLPRMVCPTCMYAAPIGQDHPDVALSPHEWDWSQMGTDYGEVDPRALPAMLPRQGANWVMQHYLRPRDAADDPTWQNFWHGKTAAPLRPGPGPYGDSDVRKIEIDPAQQPLIQIAYKDGEVIQGKLKRIWRSQLTQPDRFGEWVLDIVEPGVPGATGIYLSNIAGWKLIAGQLPQPLQQIMPQGALPAGQPPIAAGEPPIEGTFSFSLKNEEREPMTGPWRISGPVRDWMQNAFHGELSPALTPEELAQGRMCAFHPERPAVAAYDFAARCAECEARHQQTKQHGVPAPATPTREPSGIPVPQPPDIADRMLPYGLSHRAKRGRISPSSAGPESAPTDNVPDNGPAHTSDWKLGADPYPPTPDMSSGADEDAWAQQVEQEYTPNSHNLTGPEALVPWAMGKEAKGLVMHDGSVVTWQHPFIHHPEVAQMLGPEKVRRNINSIDIDGTARLDFGADAWDHEAVKRAGLRPTLDTWDFGGQPNFVAPDERIPGVEY